MTLNLSTGVWKLSSHNNVVNDSRFLEYDAAWIDIGANIQEQFATSIYHGDGQQHYQYQHIHAATYTQKKDDMIHYQLCLILCNLFQLNLLNPRKQRTCPLPYEYFTSVNMKITPINTVNYSFIFRKDINSIFRQSYFKNGGKIFLQKFGKQLPDNNVSHPIKNL